MATSLQKFSLMAAMLLASSVTIAWAQDKLDRTVLPIQEPKRPTYKELDARNAKAPPQFQVKAPKGAPNVVIVLIDSIIRWRRTIRGVAVKEPVAAAAD